MRPPWGDGDRRGPHGERRTPGVRGARARSARLHPRCLRGAGALHAVQLAEALSIDKILIPPAPGNLSAMGLLCADVRHDLIRTRVCDLGTSDPQDIRARYDSLLEEAQRTLDGDRVPAPLRHCLLSADIRYHGQNYELNLPVSDRDFCRRVWPAPGTIPPAASPGLTATTFPDAQSSLSNTPRHGAGLQRPRPPGRTTQPRAAAQRPAERGGCCSVQASGSTRRCSGMSCCRPGWRSRARHRGVPGRDALSGARLAREIRFRCSTRIWSAPAAGPASRRQLLQSSGTLLPSSHLIKPPCRRPA